MTLADAGDALVASARHVKKAIKQADDEQPEGAAASIGRAIALLQRAEDALGLPRLADFQDAPAKKGRAER